MKRIEKTTLVAILGGVIALALTAAVLMGKIDGAGYATALAGVGTFIGVLVGFFARDGKRVSNKQKKEEDTV